MRRLYDWFDVIIGLHLRVLKEHEEAKQVAPESISFDVREIGRCSAVQCGTAERADMRGRKEN